MRMTNWAVVVFMMNWSKKSINFISMLGNTGVIVRLSCTYQNHHLRLWAQNPFKERQCHKNACYPLLKVIQWWRDWPKGGTYRLINRNPVLINGCHSCPYKYIIKISSGRRSTLIWLRKKIIREIGGMISLQQKFSKTGKTSKYLLCFFDSISTCLLKPSYHDKIRT